jgi:hypothetical protein
MDQNTKSLIEVTINDLEEEDRSDLQENVSNACQSLQEVRRRFYGTPVGDNITEMMKVLDEMMKTIR